MIFAEKGAVEKRAMRKGRRAERERIARMLAEYGVDIPPELARKLKIDSGAAETGAK